MGISRVVDKLLDKFEESIACPYCGEHNFDLIGLKSHLLHDCEKFQETQNLPRLSI